MMSLIVDNTNFSLKFSLTYLKVLGLWPSADIAGWERVFYFTYAFVIFMLILGTYIVIQLVDLCIIWGNLPLMTSTAFLLCTNLVHSVKIINLLLRRHPIGMVVEKNDAVLRSAYGQEKRNIVEGCKRGTNIHLITFLSLTMVTLIGFAAGPALESHSIQLPLRGWYPYNWRKSPAYELTYAHQIVAIYLAAYLNVSKDMVVVSLLAQCRCRLKLLAYTLSNLCHDLNIGTKLISKHQEAEIENRLDKCIEEHKDILETVNQLQRCFSKPTFAQFTVSLVIICVTAFQITSQTGNLVRMVSMATYLLNMMEQVFIYCYEGNELLVESENLSRSAYEFQWYVCSVRMRRSVLILMTRCCRTAKVTAGGFTTLSLDSFKNILKASYTFFTVLRQVSE